jgi:hypothetical protein
MPSHDHLVTKLLDGKENTILYLKRSKTGEKTPTPSYKVRNGKVKIKTIRDHHHQATKFVSKNWEK